VSAIIRSEVIGDFQEPYGARCIVVLAMSASSLKVWQRSQNNLNIDFHYCPFKASME
jgi:hypothetical protein